MGLTKEEMTNFGVNATYWSIFSTEIFWDLKRSTFVIAGYVDQDSKNNGSNYLVTKEFNTDISFMDDIPVANMSDFKSAVYGVVKSQVSTLKDSVDVLEKGQKVIDITPYLPKVKVITPEIPYVDPNFEPNYPAPPPPEEIIRPLLPEEIQPEEVPSEEIPSEEIPPE